MKIQQQPIVQPSRERQLELAIAHASATMTPTEALNYVIKLYGEEFEKANARIDQLVKENDEQFRVSQKIVIANRELTQERALIEFIEANAVQLWPERDQNTGIIKAWIAQMAKPFIQTSRASVRAALVDLRDKLDNVGDPLPRHTLD